jgi:molybdenum cofactor cytidylyltransferase
LKNTSKIAILVMAAGAASRMQKVKQLLPWKGSNLLSHTLKTLREVQKQHLYVVLGANYDTIIKQIDFAALSTSIIHNTSWEKGLGNSISCGVAHILNQDEDYEGILVCLADQPLMDTTYYKAMISEFQRKNHPIVATKYAAKAGVPALFRDDVVTELIRLDADTGAKKVLAKYKNAIYIFDAGARITDIDTPEEYQKLYEHYN